MDTQLSTDIPLDDITQIRAFNRLVTRRLGLLRPGLLDSPWSLTEARILYELRNHDCTEAVDLRRSLDMDAGQLSRVLTRMENNGLITRSPSPEDGRRQVIELSGEGADAAAMLDDRSNDQIRELIGHLSPADRRRLLSAMTTVSHLFGEPATDDRPSTVVMRPLRPGDLGWVIERNGALYAEEHGWDQTYEALVAKVAADYGQAHDPRTENAWVAEIDGERVGAIFCVREDDTTARLRLLFVEPSARGHGVGGHLVDTCVAFARPAGYKRMVLWTVSVLAPARRIYQRAGFRLVKSEPGRMFGHDLVGQTWELDLV
ncbi:GNAT family N-acetyltransferase [Nocardiopsis gilva YIM 90087]|uniref:GNAT family N-acetyltransferase n=1 Tax=Nocardiopsis gilva YIM 90087 TaxID=1235441 RepID=A0A223S2M5_9ACTN|nr:bifunctional helix-turn-helix transcriptional regulator/GNAT family N-acetyltransferase [Nocardiopsis gilva]ASU82382.1 GNAT family N-acetyltransferase [Nocardiopsis gilva YIM 90087]